MEKRQAELAEMEKRQAEMTGGNPQLALKKKEAFSERIAGLSGLKKGQAYKSDAPCCDGDTAECMACRVHMPVLFYCRKYATTPGCADVRQRTSPKSGSLRPTLPPLPSKNQP